MSIEKLRSLPCWRGEIAAQILKGGLSNESWKVTDDAGDHVARFGVDFPFHHVFRDRELMAARAAHAAGFAPAVTYAAPGVMVSDFLAARAWGEEDMRAAPERIGALLGDFHARMPGHVTGAPAIFWVFHVIRDYVRTLDAHGSAFAPEARALLPVNQALEAAQVPMPIVFGHHDLLPGNFLDDGRRLWLIDFEYAAFGTGMFDLAGAAGNAGMTGAEEARLLRAYFGRAPEPDILQSFAAMKCAALMREAMWAMVSAIFLTAPGADYEAHARDYLGRLAGALEQYQTSYGKITT